jgi:hypothetical protein
MNEVYYTTVTKTSRGWVSVLVWVDSKGEALPYTTGQLSYVKRSAAVKDAKEWADAEGVECRAPSAAEVLAQGGVKTL